MYLTQYVLMFMLHTRTKFYVSIFLQSPINYYNKTEIHIRIEFLHVAILLFYILHQHIMFVQSFVKFVQLADNTRTQASTNARARLRGQHGEHMSLYF